MAVADRRSIADGQNRRLTERRDELNRELQKAEGTRLNYERELKKLNEGLQTAIEEKKKKIGKAEKDLAQVKSYYYNTGQPLGVEK